MSDISFVEYRNALYQGGFIKGRREGKGILITDQGQIFIGTWKNDYLTDRALIFTDEKTYVVGDFNRGEMDGEFVYRSPKGTFYASFSNNRLTGRLLNIDRVEQRARLMEYKKPSYEALEQYKKSSYQSLQDYKNPSYRTLDDQNVVGIKDPQVFEEMLGFKVELPNLQKFIEDETEEGGFYEKKTLNTGAIYVGFKKGTTVERLGFVANNGELVSFGVYKEMVLNGLGCQFANKTRYQGVFKNGLLNGVGLKYQILQNKFVIGHFVDGNLKEMDDLDDSAGLPDISEMKRSIHLRSVYFYNSFVQSSSLLSHQGYQDTIAKSNPQQEYVYADSPIKRKGSQKSQQLQKTSKSTLLTESLREQKKLFATEEEDALLNKSRRKLEKEPQLRGAQTLLSKIESKNEPGSLGSYVRQYEEVESLKKKSSKGNY